MNATRFAVDAEKQIDNSTTLEGLGIHVNNLHAPIPAGGHPRKNRENHGGPSRHLQTTCPSGSSFDIVSSVFPDLEGCHQASTDTSGGEPIYVGISSLVSALLESDAVDAIVSKIQETFVILQHGE